MSKPIPVLKRVVNVREYIGQTKGRCSQYVDLDLACGHRATRKKSQYKDTDRVKCPYCTNGVSPGE